MLGDGGLRDVEHPRCLRNVRLLGNCSEDGEPVVHGYGCSSVGALRKAVGLDHHAARLHVNVLESLLFQNAGSNIRALSRAADHGRRLVAIKFAKAVAQQM